MKGGKQKAEPKEAGAVREFYGAITPALNRLLAQHPRLRFDGVVASPRRRDGTQTRWEIKSRRPR